MRRAVRVVAGLLVFSAVCGASPVSVAAQEIGATHELTRLAEGVFAVEGVYQGASALIVINEDGVLIVDTHGSPASAAALLEDVALLSDQPVRWVVNTHWHADHHTGNQAYYRAFPDGVEFIAHHTTREDIPELARQQLLDMREFLDGPANSARESLASGMDEHGNDLTEDQRNQIERYIAEQERFLSTIDADEIEFVLPNLTFEHSLVVHSRTRPIHVLHFHKAHTRGDVVVFLPEERILAAGDLLTKPILWSWSSWPAEYVQTLRALEQLDFDRMLIGHGGVLEGKDYLVQSRQFLEAVVERVSGAIAEGVDIEQVQATPGEAIESFRSLFVSDTEDENSMFDSMVGWTIERAYLEATGEL